jgi:hypothetical protein
LTNLLSPFFGINEWWSYTNCKVNSFFNLEIVEKQLMTQLEKLLIRLEVLGFPYPGGPLIDRIAKGIKTYKFTK